MLLALNSKMVAQSASANISATIVSPVGAEKHSDLTVEGFSAGASGGTIIIFEEGIQKTNGGIKLSKDRRVTIASLNIIGNSTDYSINVQPEPIIFTKAEGNRGMYAKVFALSSNSQSDNLHVVIGAAITVNAHQNKGYYTSPFEVTINFN